MKVEWYFFDDYLKIIIKSIYNLSHGSLGIGSLWTRNSKRARQENVGEGDS